MSKTKKSPPKNKRSLLTRIFLWLLASSILLTSGWWFYDYQVNGEIPYVIEISTDLIQKYFSIQTTEPPKDSHFGYGYGDPNYPVHRDQMELLRTSAIKFSGHIAMWGRVEHYPPSPTGKHVYTWSWIDLAVKKFQNTDEDLYFIIRSRNPWAREGGEESDAHDYPPDPEHLSSYGLFVQQLVERYDGDGVNDMENLKNPIKFWGISSEVHNSSMWAGTQAEYARVLQTAHQNIKKADPEATVVLAGINTSECLQLKDTITYQTIVNPDLYECQSGFPNGFPAEKLAFIRANLTLHAYFDVVDFHANHSWQGIPDTVDFLKKEMNRLGYQKPIWAGDMLNAPLITHMYENSPELIQKLAQNDATTIQWFRTEQQSHAMKKIVAALGNGVEKVFLEPVTDVETETRPSWHYMGILDKKATPRPVYRTYALLIEKLSGFTFAKEIPAIAELHHYEFMVNEKPISVMWGNHPLRIPSYYDKVTITDLNGLSKVIENPEFIQIPADPVFVEPE